MLDQLMVECHFQSVILLLHAMSCDATWNRWIVKNRGQIKTARLPVVYGWLRFQHVDAAHHIIHFLEAHFGHELAHLFRDKEKEIDDVFGLSRELRAKHWVLRGDSYRASIEMTLAHHDAAQRN